MKIGELAATAQCSVETVRYYEKEGLLPKPERGGNNYRLYGPHHLRRLLFVRNCRTLDMSHEEVHSLLKLMDKSENDCGLVNDLLDEHIAHVDARIVELQHLKAQLTALRGRCHSQTNIGNCRILKGLASMKISNRPSQTHL